MVRRWPGARAAGRFFAYPRRAHRECLLSLGSAGGRCRGIEGTEVRKYGRRGREHGPGRLTSWGSASACVPLLPAATVTLDLVLGV